MILSAILTVVELTVVVVPDTVKLPLTVTSAPLKLNALLNELENVFKLLVAVCNVPITVLLLPVYEFNEPVVVSSDVNLLFCVVFVVLFDPVYVLKSVLILPLALSKDVNLLFCVVLTVIILPVAVSKAPNLLFWVVFVVLFELVYVLKSVLILPLALSNELSLPFALEVNVFKLLVAVCKVPITVLLLPVYVLSELIDPVTLSILVNLLFCVVFVVLFDSVWVLKSVLILPLALSKDVNLPLALDVNVFKLPVLISNELILLV
jgi:hypothetical protein